jgi:hypothetical protein
MKLDFNAMTKAELRAYLIGHPNEREAFYAFVDRFTADASPETIPMARSQSEIKEIEQKVEQMKKRRRKEILAFQGFYGESYCQVNLYDDVSNPVVIISELKANQGTSATNCIETVVSDITRKYKLDPEKTVFIHHCPEGQGMFWGREDFHRVPVKWKGDAFEMTTSGKWQELTRSEVEQLIDSPFKN